MKYSLKNYVLIKKKCISSEYCEEILNELKKYTFKNQHFYDSKNEKYFLPAKSNKFIDNKINSTEHLLKLISFNLNEYIKNLNFKWFQEIKSFTLPQFHKFNKGELMTNHCDHNHFIFDGKNKGVPILSIIGLLNNKFKGGETILLSKNIKLSTGDIVIFPSNFMFPHEIKEVKEGVRYSFVSWAW